MKLWKKWLAMALAVAMITPSQMMAPAATITAEASETIWLTDEELDDAIAIAPESWGAVPNEEQLWYMKEGLAAFCHFGPNTYNNVEWGQSYGTRTPSDIFQLDNAFDADYIVRTIKEAGFGKLILTCKHHDGLCLWNTETTNYSVANTDNADAYGGDILEALSDACTKYNVDMGCYLSPWDIHEDKYGCFGDVNKALPGGFVNSEYKDYNELYIDQITEICTAVKTDENGNPLTDENGDPIYKYGNNNPNRRSDRFVEWWMDGAKGDGDLQAYDWNGIIGAIREHNPSCQIFGTGKAAKNSINPAVDTPLAATGGIHWIGNEHGYAAETTWAKVNSGADYEDLPKENSAYVGVPNGDVWSVPEADVRILAGWFWRDSAGDNTTKSETQMAQIYFDTVGHGATLLLNLSPNKEGTVGEQQMAAFTTLGENIKETFDEDLTKAEGVTAKATSVWGNSKAYSASKVLDEIPEGEVYDETYWAPEEGQTTGSLEIDLGGLKTFDLVSLEEYIQKGQTIKSFTVEYKNAAGRWEEFATGTTISSLRLCRREAVEGRAIRVTINDAYSTPMLVNVGVYKMAEGFEVEAEEQGEKIPENLEYKGIMEFNLDSSWIKENNDTSAWSNAAKGGVASFTFTGTQAWIVGTIDPNHGTMDVYIDGRKITSVDTYSTERKMDSLLYVTPELAYGEHTVRMVCTKAAIGLGGAYYLDGSGVFNVSPVEMSMLYGSTAEIKIVREKGSKGQVEVTYYTESAGAEQGVNYVNLTDTVVFEDGETEKTVVLTGLINERNADGKDFFFTIGDAQKIVGDAKKPACVGESSYAHVTLYTVNTELLLENANKIDTSMYSEKTVKAFEDAILALESCVANGATEEGLAEAAKVLLDAQNALAVPAPEDKEYKITATAGEHGTITPAGETVINGAESKEYTITPDEGFVVADVVVNGESVGAVETYTVKNPTADVTISATFAFGYYTEANPYQIPAKMNETVTLEAEHFILENTGENEQWILGVADGTWASNGKFVNCINANDKIKLYYNAPVVGRYSVTLTYRSGSNSNSFTLEEANGKIIGGSVTAGNGDASVTKTKTFDLVVTQAGAGLITLTGGSAGAAQMDKFEITLVSDHEHTYSESWTAGEEGHWKACTHTECEVCGGCDAKSNMSAHTYNWTVEKAATCTEAGTEVGTCSVCYIVTTRTIEANGHDYAEVWSKDGQNHWKECTVENCDAVSEKAEHTYGEWTVKTAATCAKAGEEVRSCSVCGAEETRAIGKLATHVSGTEWLKDTNNHWHVCTVEGCTEKTDVAAHTWDAGVETKKPTATVAGEKTYTCTVCKETKKETVPATGTQDGATKPSESLPKKNSKVEYKGMTYKVTKPAKKNGTVSFVKAKASATNVTIPATIKIKGVTYNVTAIEKNAFNKNKKVKTITVGTNVTTIGATAFNNCAKLKKITFKTTKLNKSKLAKTAFRGIKKSTRIVVNKKKVNAYKTMFRSKGLGKTVKVTK